MTTPDRILDTLSFPAQYLDVGEALDGALNFFPLVMPAYSLQRHDLRDRVHLVFEPLYNFGPVSAFFTETVVTAFLQIAPFLARQPSPMPEIHLRQAALGPVEAYEIAFNCRSGRAPGDVGPDTEPTLAG